MSIYLGTPYEREDSDVTTARALDAAVYAFYDSATQTVVKPDKALVTFDGAVRYCRDGSTPNTTNVGDLYDPAVNGQPELLVYGIDNIRRFQVVAVTGTVRMHATYFR